MSIPRNTTISCPKCGHKYQVTVFDSVNTDYSPNIAETIISGDLFDAKCPSCGFTTHLEYDVLYNDMKHEAMIWVVHTNNPNYEKRIAEARATRLLPYKVNRIVSDMAELREKVACLEAGRDDRVIELCKEFLVNQLLEQQPSFRFSSAFYTYFQGKEYVYFYDVNGEKAHCELEDKVYDLILALFKKPLAQMSTSPFPIIDATWASSFFDKADFSAVKDEDKASPPLQAAESHKDAIAFCHKCGNKLVSGSRFCNKCGTKIPRREGN